MDHSQYSKALVTGGAGFIGSHVVERLLKIGIQTIVLDNLSVGKKKNIPKGAEFILGDVCDGGIVRDATDGVDVIFHLAARVSIRDSFRTFEEDVRTNVMGTVNLLKHTGKSTVKKFIHASSMAVYGDTINLPIDEQHYLAPKSPYGISKLASEKYVQCFCEHNKIKPIILRYFNTYGPKQTPTPYVGVMTIFIQRLLKGQSLPIFGDGRQVRDFIYVDDVAAATILAMNYEGEISAFNIGSGKGTDINSLAQILKEAMNKSVQIEYLPVQPGELADSIADIELAKKELGFLARWSIQEKLPEVIEWNIKNQT